MRCKNASLRILPVILVLIVSSCSRQAEGSQGSAPPAAFSFTRQPASEIVFLSTQLNPVEEAAKMRNVILQGFPGSVDFRPNDNSYLFSQIDVLLGNGPARPILVGALHADLAKLWEDGKLRPLDDVMTGLADRNFPDTLTNLCRLDGKHFFYIPWMQATYIMVANRKALPYLPKGASPETLTYEQLLEWGRNIYEKTGKASLGFPAGAKGLMHRFFQGYLYPSFTGSTLLKFRTPEAVSMWSFFRRLWQYVNPTSITYSTMADPLLSEDVLVAWDHTARLFKALEQRPGDFIAFPAPRGPRGRGFMPVVSGLAIPAGGRTSDDQAILIDFLTRPEIQNRMLRETGFFPVLGTMTMDGLPPYLVEMKKAVVTQAEAPDSIPVLMPIGLGDRGGDFNSLYMLSFSRIVLEGGDIARTLDANAALLQEIIDERNLKCWLPDVSEKRPCRIE